MACSDSPQLEQFWLKTIFTQNMYAQHNYNLLMLQISVTDNIFRHLSPLQQCSNGYLAKFNVLGLLWYCRSLLRLEWIVTVADIRCNNPLLPHYSGSVLCYNGPVTVTENCYHWSILLTPPWLILLHGLYGPWHVVLCKLQDNSSTTVQNVQMYVLLGRQAGSRWSR